MAPEVFEEKYGAKADIWSVGGVIYQMVTGSPPWKGLGFKSPVALFMHLRSHNNPPELPELKNCDDHDRPLLDAILSRCFQRDPAMRPNASTLLSDPFLNNNCSDVAAPSPKTPNLMSQMTAKERPMKSPNFNLLKSPLNQIPIPEDRALSATLADSLCYSLTLHSPFAKVEEREEEADTSGWPAWAKRCNKENPAHLTANKSSSKGRNPFSPKAKKAPFATTNTNVV